MYQTNLDLLGFGDTAKRTSRVRGRSLEIRRVDFRLELLWRFSRALRGRNVFGGASAGGGFSR